MGGGGTTLKESPYQRALAEIAEAENAKFRSGTLPLIDQSIRMTQKQGSGMMMDRAAGIASSGVMAKAEPVLGEQLRGVTMAGGAPRLAMFDASRRAALAGATSGANFGARFGQQTGMFQGLESSLGMLRGEQSGSRADLAEVAGTAQSRAMGRLSQEMATDAAIGEGVGTAAGMAAYGLWNRRKD